MIKGIHSRFVRRCAVWHLFLLTFFFWQSSSHITARPPAACISSIWLLNLLSHNSMALVSDNMHPLIPIISIHMAFP
uniref:Putative secreted protein n=1 Tax=Anopheles darlingi TaxID=43151 RepID=A0A2M4D4E8_ANODA